MVMLLNLLIAQLTDRYQTSRADAKLEVDRIRTDVVLSVENNIPVFGLRVRMHYFFCFMYRASPIEIAVNVIYCDNNFTVL